MGDWTGVELADAIRKGTGLCVGPGWSSPSGACTRPDGHRGPHAAGDGRRVVAVWEHVDRIDVDDGAG